MALGFSLQAVLGFVLGGAIYPIQEIFPLFVVSPDFARHPVSYLTSCRSQPLTRYRCCESCLGETSCLISCLAQMPTANETSRYGIFLSLGEVGPGSTVVLCASECFPTSIRGQMMGFVAAWSKAGAAIGTQVFTAILNAYTTDPSKGDQVLVPQNVLLWVP